VSRRDLAILVAVVVCGLVSAGTWRVAHRHRTTPSRPMAAFGESMPQVGVPNPSDEELPPFALPEEPAPPARGTPAHDVYFKAMVEGDEHALAVARKALADAQSANARPAYVRHMEAMERTYAERLARHQQELTHPAP
jgi:hypothetical protein